MEWFRAQHIKPEEVPLDVLTQIDKVCHGSSLSLTANGQTVPVPPSIVELILLATDSMKREESVMMLSGSRILSSQQAADLLGVSRPHMVKLLESGKIPFTLVGRHRRIRLDHLLTYRDTRREERSAALSSITKMLDEADLYDRTS